MSARRTLLIDNYDSFTFNLYQALAVVNGEPPVVVKNNEVTWNDLRHESFDQIVLSPGPGRPERAEDFGVCRDVLRYSDLPLLGVCLGHEGLAWNYGASIVHAPEPMHGRSSTIFHDGSALFAELPETFEALRYHSLVVAEPLPEVLQKIAWTRDGLVMALRHRHKSQWGVQFHPESIGTPFGTQLLRNFCALTPTPHRTQHTPRPSYAEKKKPTRRVQYRKQPLPCSAEALFSSFFSSAPWAFWLDSSRHEPGLARFSYMGAGAAPTAQWLSFDATNNTVTEHQHTSSETRAGHIYNVLEAWLAKNVSEDTTLPFPFVGGFVGYFGYETALAPEASLQHARVTPDASFLFVDRLVVIDHEEQQLYFVALVSNDEPNAADEWFSFCAEQLRSVTEPSLESDQQQPLSFRLREGKEQYSNAIAQCQKFLLDGESYELCLTTQLLAPAMRDPFSLYRRLRKNNPAPYAAFVRLPEAALLCSSPERFLRIDCAGNVDAKPIKGTRPRATDPRIDEALKTALATDEKDRSENLMIVDLLRNDLGVVCEPGSVTVPSLMAVESYATVHQLVSTIAGKLRADRSAVACVAAAFPGGSMTGAPKVRTVQLLQQLETQPRGIYAGALGFFSVNGAAEFNIVIRTLVCTETQTSLGIGGAIVALSKTEDEFEEILVKARAPVQAMLQHCFGSTEAAERVLEQLRTTGSVVLRD